MNPIGQGVSRVYIPILLKSPPPILMLWGQSGLSCILQGKLPLGGILNVKGHLSLCLGAI